jgi:hypothetical protein
MRHPVAAYLGIIVNSLICGCATQVPPLTYIASEKPAITVNVEHQSPIKKDFSRGGWYFGNSNFRPAPDVGSYVRETETEAKASVLRNADVEFAIPFVLNLLFFGYNLGTDVVNAGDQLPTK